jgi:hypothetical protein
MSRIVWPNGKAFAFTVFDDTDGARLNNIRPIYNLLADCGMRTTKSAWPLCGSENSALAGDTCDNDEYVAWLQELQREGFEIGYHMASWDSSVREKTEKALDRFAELFGPPKSMAGHSQNRENLYWGEDRLTGMRKFLYKVATGFRYSGRFTGHVDDSSYFWGDFAKERATYCRNFVYPGINTLKCCPIMPYKDPLRPRVNYWFASSEGANAEQFINCISGEAQDQLEQEGGACIMYTHFASGFCDNGLVSKRFASLIRRLSGKNGWFVPVGTLLDFLRETNGDHVITNAERCRLEWKWMWHKSRFGRS